MSNPEEGAHRVTLLLPDGPQGRWMALSRPQIKALRYAKSQQLYAQSINNGNGNMRRSILWLINNGLLGWDPIYHGRVMLTPAGDQALIIVREIEIAENKKLRTIDKNKLQEIHATGHAAKRKLHSVVKGGRRDVPSR